MKKKSQDSRIPPVAWLAYDRDNSGITRNLLTEDQAIENPALHIIKPDHEKSTPPVATETSAPQHGNTINSSS